MFPRENDNLQTPRCLLIILHINWLCPIKFSCIGVSRQGMRVGVKLFLLYTQVQGNLLRELNKGVFLCRLEKGSR